MVTILSIDGGGIRGLLPALALREIARRLDLSGEERPISRLFDLIAGTSTGALIALGLAMRDGDGRQRYSTSDIVELYMRRGKEIFLPPLRSSLHTAVQAFHNKYRAEGFERLLRDIFGNATLRDSATNLLLTSFDTETMRPHCMKRRPPNDAWGDEFDFYMRDAARASAAAPTYFPPARISPVGFPQVSFSLIDGGVFANNPSGLAYVEATTIFPDEREFLILSLGTGDLKRGYRYEEIHSWGYVEWVNPAKGFPIGAIMSAGQSEAVSHQLDRLEGVHYVRVNTSLAGCTPAIDDVSKKNLDCLNRLADRMVAAHDREIEYVCSLLGAKAPVMLAHPRRRSCDHCVVSSIPLLRGYSASR